MALVSFEMSAPLAPLSQRNYRVEYTVMGRSRELIRLITLCVILIKHWTLANHYTSDFLYLFVLLSRLCHFIVNFRLFPITIIMIQSLTTSNCLSTMGCLSVLGDGSSGS